MMWKEKLMQMSDSTSIFQKMGKLFSKSNPRKRHELADMSMLIFSQPLEVKPEANSVKVNRGGVLNFCNIFNPLKLIIKDFLAE